MNSSTTAGRSSAELLRAARASEPDAWRRLIERFEAMVWSIARAQGLDRTDAADVCQTVWMRLVDHRDRLTEPDRLGSWLATTARHEAMRVCRLRNRTVATEDTAMLDRTATSTDGADPAVSVTGRDRDAAVWRLLGTLPMRSQRVLQALMSEPAASYDQVAATLMMPVGSIGPTRQRGLRSLRARCVAAGIEP